jgi:carbamoylphosphate synthase small subunit
VPLPCTGCGRALTARLQFGNRGHNQPVISLSTIRGGASTRAGRVYVTSQNHGYALAPPTGLGTFEEGTGFIEECDWPAGWEPLFVNANDGSIEGIQMSE